MCYTREKKQLESRKQDECMRERERERERDRERDRERMSKTFHR